MLMKRIDMSEDEYMQLKKLLSEELVGLSNSSITEGVKALSETFQVSEEEADKILQECGNDLKTAIKILRMKNLEL
jgi:predicted metal-binding transcription factor (methanogenesis marker protein 9)